MTSILRREALPANAMVALLTGFLLGTGTQTFGQTADANKNKQYQVNIDKDKKEGTINMDKKGTWQGGLGELPRKPEASKSEADRRREQTELGGRVFIQKTFP